MSTFRTPRQLLQEKAYNAVRLAVRSGKLQRLPCEWCGKQRTLGVHPSLFMSDWLTVLWLCRGCCRKWHANFTQAVPLIDVLGNPVENRRNHLWIPKPGLGEFSTPFDGCPQLPYEAKVLILCKHKPRTFPVRVLIQ